MRLETFFDMLLVEEIPVEDATSTGIKGLDGKDIVATPKSVGKPPLGKVISCGEEFPVAGVWVKMPYKVGDVISSQEYGRNYEINLNRDRKYRPELPKFYTIRFADVEGRVVPPSGGNFNPEGAVFHGTGTWDPYV